MQDFSDLLKFVPVVKKRTRLATRETEHCLGQHPRQQVDVLMIQSRRLSEWLAMCGGRKVDSPEERGFNHVNV